MNKIMRVGIKYLFATLAISFLWLVMTVLIQMGIDVTEIKYLVILILVANLLVFYFSDDAT